MLLTQPTSPEPAVSSPQCMHPHPPPLTPPPTHPHPNPHPLTLTHTQTRHHKLVQARTSTLWASSNISTAPCHWMFSPARVL